MWAGGVFGAYFGGIGVIPGAIIGGVMGGVLGSWSISSVTEYGVNKYYQR